MGPAHRSPSSVRLALFRHAIPRALTVSCTPGQKVASTTSAALALTHGGCLLLRQAPGFLTRPPFNHHSVLPDQDGKLHCLDRFEVRSVGDGIFHCSTLRTLCSSFLQHHRWQGSQDAATASAKRGLVGVVVVPRLRAHCALPRVQILPQAFKGFTLMLVLRQWPFFLGMATGALGRYYLDRTYMTPHQIEGMWRRIIAMRRGK